MKLIRKIKQRTDARIINMLRFTTKDAADIDRKRILTTGNIMC